MTEISGTALQQTVLRHEDRTVQWLIELSRISGEPSVSVITQKALGFVFAFGHQIPMVSVCEILGG